MPANTVTILKSEQSNVVVPRGVKLIPPKNTAFWPQWVLRDRVHKEVGEPTHSRVAIRIVYAYIVETVHYLNPGSRKADRVS